MSMSLPKIKVTAENSQHTSSQKNLKFKKLKLSTDQTTNMQRFKSHKTQRLTSLQRYSTVQEQRQYRNEKIHMNLLERKLLTGTYDETKETGNDLNLLKQKTDSYRSMSVNKKKEIQKIKQSLEALKKEVDIYSSEKKTRESKISEAKERFESQKEKTEKGSLEKDCLEYMIVTRNNLNIYLENKLNESKVYLSKLKSLEHQINFQLREYNEKSKNLQTQIKKFQEEMTKEQRIREGSIYEKQISIEKRTEGDIERDKKSKQYLQYLTQVQKQEEEKSFNDLYYGILCHKFLQKYGNLTLNSLYEKYQIIENRYKRLASYKTFNREQPKEIVSRYEQHKEEEETFRQKIKALEAKVLEKEKKKQENQQLYCKTILISKKEEEMAASERDEQKQKIKLKHEKECSNLMKETIEMERIMQKIGKWSERYGRQLQINTKKSPHWEDISRNLSNIIKVVVKETKEIEESRLLRKSVGKV